MADIKNALTSMHDKYMNLSIKYKILLFYFIIIFSISLFLGTYSYIISSSSMQSEAKRINLVNARHTASKLDFILKNVNNLSTFINLSTEIQDLVKNNNSGTTTPLDNLLAANGYISFISLYGQKNYNYYISSDGSSGLNNFKDVANSSIYKITRSLKGHPVWFNLNPKNQVFIQYNSHPKVAMCRIIIDPSTLSPKGFFSVCINTSTLKELCTSNIERGYNYFFITDGNGDIITSNTDNIDSVIKNKLKNLTSHHYGTGTIYIKGKGYIAAYASTSYANWKLVYLLPVDKLLKNVNSILKVTLLTTIICILISFIVAYFISSALTSPIKELLKSMKRVKKGNFKEKINFKYTDEIGELGREYTEMIEYISNLIEKVYVLHIKEQEAELIALQAQINPHFLYNTLDTIYWKAAKSKDTDVSEMIYSLSQLFRITLSKGNSYISIKDEMNFIENYLLLQEKKFRDKLEYDVNFDSDILEYRIPKLIIQPFVENVIVHVLECYENKIKIKITGTAIENKSLCFLIENSGPSIDPSKASLLLNEKISLEDDFQSKSEGGFAVRNIRRRLLMYYNNNFSLDIAPGEIEGTIVKIIIPIDF